MDLSKLTNAKVKKAATDLQKRRNSFESGLDQARELGLLEISKINIDKSLDALFLMADEKADHEMLEKLNAATSFSGKKKVTERTTEEGRDRVRAVQLFQALQGDGSYAVIKANINNLKNGGSDLRAMARDDKLLKNLDKSVYADRNKLLRTVGNTAVKQRDDDSNTPSEYHPVASETGGASDSNPVTRLNVEWFLDQAAYLEAHKSLEGKDPRTQSLLIIAMLNSYAKSTTIFDDESRRMGVTVNPIFSRQTNSAEYFRSSTNALLKNAVTAFAAQLQPDQGKAGVLMTQLDVVHNQTFREVIGRAFPLGAVKLVADTNDQFKKAFEDALDALDHGHVPGHYFCFDITALFKTSGTKLADMKEGFAAGLETVAVACIKTWLLAKKASIQIGPAPVVVDVDDDEVKIPIGDLLRDLGKFLHRAVLIGVTEYVPPVPPADDLAVAIALAESAPNPGSVVPCKAKAELEALKNEMTPKLSAAGFVPGKNSTLDTPISLVFFPRFFASTQKTVFEPIIHEVFSEAQADEAKKPVIAEAITKLTYRDGDEDKYGELAGSFRPHLDHTIVHTGYRPDPLASRKWWAGMVGYQKIFEACNIPLTELATPGKTPAVFKSWDDFTKHKTVVDFEALANDAPKKGATPEWKAPPYCKVLVPATIALIKGILEYEPQETMMIDAMMEIAKKDPAYGGSGSFKVTGPEPKPEIYTDDKCTTKVAATISGDALRKDTRYFVKPALKPGHTISFELTPSLNSLMIVNPAATLSLGTGSGVDRAYRARGLTDLLQTGYYRMLAAMARAISKKEEIMVVLDALELVHQELAAILTILEPYAFEDFPTAILAAMKKQAVIPAALESEAKVHLRPSALHCLASLVGSIEKLKGNQQLKVGFLNDCYYEESFAIDEWHTFERSNFDGDKVTLEDLDLTQPDVTAASFDVKKLPLDLFVGDFHHNISPFRSSYQPEDLISHVDHLFTKKLVSDKFFVAIDCTVDFIASGDAKRFLAHFEQKITDGKLGVMLFRSGQKFDMLGMDNFYGGYSITIEKLGSAPFRQRMSAPEDELTGANRQGHTHLAKHAATFLDDYRRALMLNTKRLYDKLPPASIFGTPTPGPMQVAKTTDPCNVFLDIKFPCEEKVGDNKSDAAQAPVWVKNKFKTKVLDFAKKHSLALSQRASFGFPTTNYTTILGSQARINPGLESPEMNDKWAELFTAMHTHVSKELQGVEHKGVEYMRKLAEVLDKLTLP